MLGCRQWRPAAIARRNKGNRKALDALAARLDAEQVLGLLERCLEGDAQVDRRVQLVLVLEALSDALGQRLAK